MQMTGGRALSRVPAIDERDILRDPRFHAALGKLAVKTGQPVADVEKYARRCMDDLSVRPADRFLGWTAALARFMYTRSFDREFDVNREALEELKALGKLHPLVFLWSHKSHLDGFVFMRALYDAGFCPQPLTFAGSNMNFAGFGPLVRHSGAIFLRRSFRDDDVYRLVLRFFIDYLASRRVPLSWSIEGTRSRTGQLLPPKLGLVHWVMDAYRRARIDDALFVPVAIGFDQIPEMDDYIAMQHGLPKRKESLRWFLDYIAGMKSDYGKVYVRFAKPVALSEFVAAADIAGGDEEAPGTEVQKVAFEVCNRIQRAMPVTLTDLVTLALLAANGRALDAGQIAGQAADAGGLIRRRNLPTAGDLRLDDREALREKLRSLTKTGLLQCYADGKAPVFVIAEGRQLAAAYYRNTVVQHFIGAAIAEVALMMAVGGDGDRSGIDARLLSLRDLLKFEFFFTAKPEFLREARDFLDHRYPGWLTGDDSFPHDPPPLFGQAMLRSFIEAYWILARLLLNRGWQDISPESETSLVDGCLARGREMLLRKEITTEAALSQPMFVTALRLARHRRLLTADGPAIRDRRAEFAAEVECCLSAVNRLQEAYDQGHCLRAAAPPRDARSIA